MSNEDIPACVAMSEPLPGRSERLREEFDAYPTLVAEVDGRIAGYTQFSLGPDGVLHSLALRISPEFKGQGIGQRLMDAKVALARRVGAHMHMYAVARDGEVALKKILERQGMHLCQDRGELLIYVAPL